MRRRAGAVATLAALLLLAGCSAPAAELPAASGSPAGPTSSANPSAPAEEALSGELRILAAASLTESFTDLAERFQAAHPGVTVAAISFDGSSTLATQILEGAPADVFASADQANMDKVVAEIDGTPAVFAHNTLQIAVAPGNPLGIATLADLAADGVQLVLCAPEVPCGRAAHVLLDAAGVAVDAVSEEQNVKAVLSKVQLGEADAGLVYLTDVAAAAGAVDGVPIAGAELAASDYPIAALAGAGHPAVARAFIAFVLSPEGQAILAGHGFGAS